MSPRNHSVPLTESQDHVIDPTNPRRALDDRIETGCTSVGERLMMPSTSARRRLMLQGLAQFCIALLDFFEQPHVFNGDHRLVGESFKKCDLLFR